LKSRLEYLIKLFIKKTERRDTILKAYIHHRNLYAKGTAELVFVRTNWVLGWWWDKNRIFDKEADWNNERNPVIDGLNKKILSKKGLS
jgi:hypothetical protein